MDDATLAKLAILIQTHPSWPGVTDNDLVPWVNELVIDKTLTELPNEKILEVIIGNITEFNNLTAEKRDLVRDILHVGNTVPTVAGNPTRDWLVSTFGGASDTIQALAAAIVYQVSRAADAAIPGTIDKGQIKAARATVGA